MYTLEVKENQINDCYETANKYFSSLYRLNSYIDKQYETDFKNKDIILLENFQNSGSEKYEKLREFKRTYDSLLTRYYDDYNYPTEVKLKYDIYDKKIIKKFHLYEGFKSR